MPFVGDPKLTVVKVATKAVQAFALALSGNESKEEILAMILDGDALVLGDSSSLHGATTEDVEVTKEEYDLSEGD